MSSKLVQPERRTILTKGKAFQLKPNHKYIIVLDPKVSQDTGIGLVRSMHDLGMKCLVAFMDKDSYKIIEETE